MLRLEMSNVSKRINKGRPSFIFKERLFSIDLYYWGSYLLCNECPSISPLAYLLVSSQLNTHDIKPFRVRNCKRAVAYCPRFYLSRPAPGPESGDERTAPAPTLLRQLTATSAIDCRQVHLPRNTEFTFAIWNQGWSDIGKRHAKKNAESCFYIKETFIKRDFYIQNKYWNLSTGKNNNFIWILSFTRTALTNSQNVFRFKQANLTLQWNTSDQKDDSRHDEGHEDIKV